MKWQTRRPTSGKLECFQGDVGGWRTQTGSMGMISAASARHPRPSNLMMGILARLHKAMGGAPPCRGRVGSQYAARWRSSREHTRPTVITTPPPTKMLAPAPRWAKPKQDHRAHRLAKIEEG